MTKRLLNSMPRRLLALAAALLIASGSAMSARAAEPAPAVGYGGVKIQLSPIMAPYRTSAGIRYQVVTIRLVLDMGINERPACFMVPVVHEKFLLYFYQAMLTPADFAGQRRDVVAKTLLDLATAATDRGYFSGIEIVDDSALTRNDKTPSTLDPRSQTLSTQCK